MQIIFNNVPQYIWALQKKENICQSVSDDVFLPSSTGVEFPIIQLVQFMKNSLNKVIYFVDSVIILHAGTSL